MAAAASMVKKIYMLDSYLYSLRAAVTFVGQDVKGKYLRFDQTIFHPQGGGQPCDIGTIKGSRDRKVTVINVQKEINEGAQNKSEFEIKHYYQANDIDLAIGDEIEMEIDQERRRLNAKLHSAGHLIAALVENIFPNDWKAVTGHHFPKEARVEFDPIPNNSSTAEIVRSRLTDVLSQEVKKGAPVKILIDETGRKIQMGQFEPVPCGGTHVQDLSEIGAINIREINIKKGKLRVSYGIEGEQ